MQLKIQTFIIFILVIVLKTSPAFAVDQAISDSAFIADEKRLALLLAELIEVRFDDAKLEVLSAQIMGDFEEVLKKEGSFSYPFDSIFSVGNILSEDGLVRIITWYAVRADGSHIHFGFIQYFNKDEKRVLLYPLSDKSDDLEDIQNQTFTHENWFGATYYEIVTRKSNYGPLYVLLGWDGNTIYSQKKIIESLVFTESGRPKFGKPVFVSGKNKVKRILFEYSRMSSMMLNYNDDTQSIVMDHLAPSKPVYTGNPQFYGPDLSYDALKFEDGYWVYYPTIDYKPMSKRKWWGRGPRGNP